MTGTSGCWYLLQLPLPIPCPPCPDTPSPQFGESQQLRMVRILRSTLMVRVGGGWIALDEFLVKNDPCRGGCGGPAPGTGRPWHRGVKRVHGAHGAPRVSHPPGPWDPLLKSLPSPVKGRTNLKINEKYLSTDAFGAAGKCAGNPSAASSKALSPSRSSSSLSLYSSASAPSSPMARKVSTGPPRGSDPPTGADPLPPQSVLRRTRSGDRCPRSRGSLLPDGAELQFTAAEESTAMAPPGEGWGVSAPPEPAMGPWGCGRVALGRGAVPHPRAPVPEGRRLQRPRVLAEPPEGSPPERRSPCR